MRWLFSPAITMLRRTRPATKFGVLWALSIAAIAVLVYSLSASVDRVVTQSRRQLAGIPLVGHVATTIQAVQLHRGVAAAVYAGSADLEPHPRAQALVVTRALDTVTRELPPDLAATPNYRALMES